MPSKEKKFKVCLVAISLGKGGLERSCAMLSQMLCKKGHEVHLVLLNNEIDYPFSGNIFNLGDKKTANENFLQRFLRFKNMRSFLKKESFDVIIDHRPKNNYYRELFYDGYVYKGFQRIYVIHSSKKKEYLTTNPAFSKVYNRNLKSAAVSKYIETEILNKSGINNTITIHNAYDPQWNKIKLETPANLSGKTYILSYGRLNDEIKDFTFLIKAFSLSKVWEQQVFLVILGDGKDLEKLKNLAAAQDCKNSILFLPFDPNPFPYIANARLVTLTSKYEGFPMVLVETLSVGTPVVSLDIVSGPSEIIEHGKNGLLIPERNLPLFAEALQEMCFNETLYNECKSNSKPSVSGFSMDVIAEKWNQLLQDEIH